MPGLSDPTPVTHKRQLIAWLESGAKPRERSRIGASHELFLFDRMTHQPIPYEGLRGLNIFLDELRAFKWQPLREDDNIIGLTRGSATIRLGPGGQLIFWGTPAPTLHDIAAELRHHFDELGSVCRVMGFGALGLGFHPTAKRDEMPWMPEMRYRIMRHHMPEKGSLGLDMMLRTAAARASLDYSDEADMAKKYRVSLALQPVIAAVFANSPFRDGALSGDLSFRNRAWQHTDPDRCTYLEFVFQPGFGFEHYVDYALSVPMYCLNRNGNCIDLEGASFRDFLQGRLEKLPGEMPLMADWDHHISTLFPPVRLKRFLEMRAADMGSQGMALALPALWTGLLYDSTALDAAEDLTRRWTTADRVRLFESVPKLGIDAPILGHTVREMAREILLMAEAGLKRRNRRNEWGDDESVYLAPLQNIVAHGLTQAEELVRLFCDDWNGNLSPLFEACRLA